MFYSILDKTLALESKVDKALELDVETYLEVQLLKNGSIADSLVLAQSGSIAQVSFDFDYAMGDDYSVRLLRRLSHTPLALKDTLGDKLYDAYISSMLTPFSIDEVRLMERKTLYHVSTKCGDDKTFYRFGFNGKEHDPELKGKHNVQDYGFRMYDDRLGRFFSVDPLRDKYPFYSPYHFAGNSPIQFIDLGGLEPAGPLSSWHIHEPSIKFLRNGDVMYQAVGKGQNEAWWVLQKQLENGGREYQFYAKGEWEGDPWKVFWNDQEIAKGKIVTANAFSDKFAESLFSLALTAATGGTGKLGTVIGDAGFELIKQYSLIQPDENGKKINQVDWANVAIEGIPEPKCLNHILTEVLRDCASAAVDYTTKKGLVRAGSDKKSLKEAGAEAASSIIASVAIGKYKDNLKDAFKNTDPKLLKGFVEQLTKFSTEYSKEIISSGAADATKSKKESK